MSGGDPYKATRRGVTAELTHDVHDQFEAIVRAAGLTKGGYLKKMIIREIENNEAGHLSRV